MRTLFCLTFFILSSHFSFSQNSLHFNNKHFHFREGVELLTNKKYGAARLAFFKYLKEGEDPVKRADAEYYIAYCSIQLQNADAEGRVERFIRAHPHHPKAEIAYYELGNLKYDEKEYDEAIKFYEKTNMRALDDRQRAEARFRLGYAYFTKSEFEKAYEQFNELKHSENKYQYASNYYAGYINFRWGEYDRAYYDFKRAEENEYYATIVPELILKVYYKQDRIDELIQYGEEVQQGREFKNYGDFYLYLGEGYYARKNYQKAVEYFNKFDKSQRRKPEAGVLYRMADARQKTGEHEAAMKDFKDLAAMNDTIGQFSAYHLGKLYVETGQKQYAPAAFRTAFEKNYNDEVAQNALFQYAKVSYDLGNFKEAIKSFELYSKQFGETEHQEEINEMLTDAYFKTNNYEAAISYFERMNFKTDKVKEAYQKITFEQGAALFNAERYIEAIELFDKSEAYPVDQETHIKTVCWKAETFYMLGQYNDAKNAYAKVFRLDQGMNSDEYLKARYGIAYVYFNEKNYSAALDHFKYYVDYLNRRGGGMHFEDALLRLADCYYTTKQYQLALTTYDRARSANRNISDYAFFRKGVIHGILEQLNEANQNFDQVINNYSSSTFVDDAIFQKARYNFEKGYNEVAIKWFSVIIDNYPQSKFVPYALQSRALAYSNQNNHQAAANDYSQILRKYPQHSSAEDALLSLQQELVALGKSEEFSDYVSEYKQANPDKSNLENIEFESAKTLYFEQKYRQAIDAFDRFISTYPNSSLRTEAQYYAADAAYRSGQYQEALSKFIKIKDEKSFSRYSRVIERIGEINFDQGNYQSAVQYYRKLEDIASNNKERYRAWDKLMVSYYHMSKYDSTDHYANIILDRGLIAAGSENKALLFLGKAAYDRGYLDAATDYFLTALNSAKDEYGAEAQYHIALIYYQKNKYQNSLETLFDLNSNFGVYDEWIGKSFLLMADNYIAMEEDFQAKATLESIIQNANSDELIKKAKQKLDYLRSKEDIVKDQAPDTLEIINPE